MKCGIYYCPKFNYIMIFSKCLPTIFDDYDGVDGRVWKVTVENEEGISRGYLYQTRDLVYLGGL